MTEPDLCVIGTSEAAQAAAAAGAALGLAVTLIDNGEDRDGTDNPDLVLEVMRVEAVRLAGGAAFDFEAFKSQVQRALSKAAAERRVARLSAMNIRVLSGRGRFVDRRTLVADGIHLRPWRILLAPRRAHEALPGHVEGLPVITTSDIGRLPALPDHGIVAGGGAEAVAVAQALRRFGVAVTLVAETLLPGVDPELVTPLLRSLARDGVTILRQQIATIESDARGVALRFSDESRIAGTHLVWARQSQANLDDADLHAAGIDQDGQRLVLTPAHRTTNRRVYAAGPAAGALSAQMGVAQAGTVLRAALFRLPARSKPEVAVCVTATDPQIATVGLTEQQARSRGAMTLWRWPFDQTGAQAAAGASGGHIKVVADSRGRVLGAGLVGQDVREMVGFWSLSVTRALTLGDLLNVPMPVPSLSEASRRLILAQAAEQFRNPWLRRFLRLSRRLG